MVKYAVLFAASVGVLIFFITPGEEKPAQKPVAIAVTEPAPKEQSEPEYWGEDDTDEEFVFGEPVKYSEDDDDEAKAKKSSGNTSAKVPSAKKPKPAKSVAKTRTVRTIKSAKIAKAPASGEPGSRENPVDMTPPGGRPVPQ